MVGPPKQKAHTERKIRLKGGRRYRIGRPPNIHKGQWYWVVACKGCGQTIYLLEDKSGGTLELAFVGGGLIASPCQDCVTDELYDLSELKSIEAETDIRFRPPRPEMSNMPRQPVYKRYPKVKPSFDGKSLEDRPEAAGLIAQCIALWTDAESGLARLLATMLKVNAEPAIALFLTLQSGRLQFEALNAVAGVVLTETDHELFSAMMNFRKSVEKERNHLAHGRYGISPQIKEGVMWIDPVHAVQHTVRVDAADVVTDEAYEWVRHRAFVYELGDLETIIKNIELVISIIGQFIAYLVEQNMTQREERYRQLCALPHLRRELSLMRAGRKKLIHASKGAGGKRNEPSQSH